MPSDDIIQKFAPKKRSPWKPSHNKLGGRAASRWLQIYLPAIVFAVVAVGVSLFLLFRPQAADIVVENEPDKMMEEGPMAVGGTASGSAKEEVVEERPVVMVVVTDTPIGYLNVRSGPGTGFTRVDRIDPGSSYPFVEESDGWYRIQLDDENDGWVINDYASLSAKTEPLE